MTRIVDEMAERRNTIRAAIAALIVSGVAVSKSIARPPP
jgi:hypothetical protein